MIWGDRTLLGEHIRPPFFQEAQRKEAVPDSLRVVRITRSERENLTTNISSEGRRRRRRPGMEAKEHSCSEHTMGILAIFTKFSLAF